MSIACSLITKFEYFLSGEVTYGEEYFGVGAYDRYHESDALQRGIVSVLTEEDPADVDDFDRILALIFFWQNVGKI
jgi:hypothetical protein